jgi:hypothetical protein
MRRIASFTILAATLLVCARSSLAQEAAPVVAGPRAATHGTGVGVGVTGFLLNGPQGLSGAYDAGPWHAEAILGLFKPGGSRASFALGANFWYHLHSTANADFSVGGGLGYRRQGMATTSADGFWIQLGGQIRVFLAANVALSGTLGLAISTSDFEAYGLGGQSLSTQTLGGFAGVGLHYYFY